jgi:hypothetical protein
VEQVDSWAKELGIAVFVARLPDHRAREIAVANEVLRVKRECKAARKGNDGTQLGAQIQYATSTAEYAKLWTWAGHRGDFRDRFVHMFGNLLQRLYQRERATFGALAAALRDPRREGALGTSALNTLMQLRSMMDMCTSIDLEGAARDYGSPSVLCFVRALLYAGAHAHAWPEDLLAVMMYIIGCYYGTKLAIQVICHAAIPPEIADRYGW